MVDVDGLKFRKNCNMSTIQSIMKMFACFIISDSNLDWVEDSFAFPRCNEDP